LRRIKIARAIHVICGATIWNAAMARIMIVVGHAEQDTFCEALGRAYERGARAGGHRIDFFDLSRMNFDAILHFGNRKLQPLEPDLETARAALRECDHLVILFPLWLGDMPAILKGFLERIMQPWLLAKIAEGPSASWKFFKNKSARIVITMGMPGFVYRLWFGAHALKLLRHNILRSTGIRPVRDTILGGVTSVTPERRQQWLAEMEQLGEHAG
jgi:putative NADPH-quinone reductase